MSRGPGTIERRIADLFADTRDRALSVDDICQRAFTLKDRPATRAQRLSATRAAHRLLRRVRDAEAKSEELGKAAHAATQAALGRSDWSYMDGRGKDTEYRDRLQSEPAQVESEKLFAFAKRIGRWNRLHRHPEKRGWLKVETDYWCTTITPDKRLFFHPPDARPSGSWLATCESAAGFVLRRQAGTVKREFCTRCHVAARTLPQCS
jgi:hypothetical protein